MTKEVVTPNGFKVTLKNSLTYGDYEKIQDAVSAEIKIPISDETSLQSNDPQKPRKEISMMALRAGQKAAMSIMVIKILSPDDKEVQLYDIPIEDGVFISAEIDKVVDAGKPLSKKN